MDEVRYMISEASKRIEVEAHVLRYWEDELELPISRNEMGHRYYKAADIELLKTVKHLKEQGFQLKAVKMLLPNIHKLDSLDSQTVIRLRDKLNGKVFEMLNDDKQQENIEGTSLITNEKKHEIKEETNDKMGQFKAIMNQIIMSALKENNTLLSEEISMNVTDGVIKEMNYLMRLQEEKEEERYKKFDATLRDYQKSRMQAAASMDRRGRKKSKFFKKNKVYI
ncbi:MerR family transcriptional regulator [Mobilitalea sibirica]|uniref:MerR family transcriptional regulator n=1 Tax=Mobilitalea sibirica TaxID=1462919 RepID=A0A8J7KVY2_9FIRM|nr:helix-turn-helix domain-containing protein [Mobilitalea sibirica]MBH1940705.1 MerR family transcriptional regulator [Mobilitalea sibirica]